MNKLYSLIVLAAFMFSTTLFAQNFSISGVVTDASTGEALIGANVYLTALSTGATTNTDGVYVIENLPKGTYAVAASYVGYIKDVKNTQVLSDVTLDFSLRPSAVLMDETVVQGTRATLRETPVAFTEIEGADIDFKLASRDVPQMLNTVPNVYSSMGGGGAGDADLHVRGFNQRDIAIMINGVPVNDMENGWVYWSNWAGLGDVTKSIQVQRGLGSSPYSVNAIGGIVNVETHGAGNRQEYVRLKTEFGEDNLSKLSIAFSTALTENIGFTFLGSRKTWDGYAVNTPLDEYTFFFSFGGIFGNHSLELTGLGSPQEHGQRLYEQSISTWGDRGFDYNPNWGYLNGRVVWERYNKFSKPQFNLNWNWQMSDQTILSSTGYLSVGNGFGTGHIGSGVIYARDDAGQYNYDLVWSINTSNIDSNYSSSLNRSVSAIRESHNDHFWVGLLSTLKHNFSSNLTLNVGIDGRYYVGNHYRTLANMIGGDYFLETHDKNNPDKLASIGDTVAYHNDGIVTQYGGFAQVEYTADKFSLFLNVSGSNTGFNRIDYFNFLTSDPDRETGNEWFVGYTAKTGINFNIDKHNNIFANVGYFSRAPIFDNVYDFANNKYDNIVNEKILGIEAGYGLSTPKFAMVINGFYTKWEDRAISRSVRNDTTGENFYYNIVGANQRHVGGEFEGRWKPLGNLEFSGMFSYSENVFENDVEARIAPEDDPNQYIEIKSFVKDLYVGAFPMTSLSLAMVYNIELSSGTSLTINPVFKFLDRFYTDFDPDDRTDPDDREQSWQIPNYYILDAHAALDILFTDFFFKRMNISFHLFNALNTINYIVQGTDGSTHTSVSAEVFYGRSRWWNIGVLFDF
jgi:outer membrane cobalamin receptor